jgi:hypothetical protein
MEKQANAIYDGRVCDKEEDLRHIHSIVTAKLSAIQATHGISLLFVVVD